MSVGGGGGGEKLRIDAEPPGAAVDRVDFVPRIPPVRFIDRHLAVLLVEGETGGKEGRKKGGNGERRERERGKQMYQRECQ